MPVSNYVAVVCANVIACTNGTAAVNFNLIQSRKKLREMPLYETQVKSKLINHLLSLVID